MAFHTGDGNLRGIRFNSFTVGRREWKCLVGDPEDAGCCRSVHRVDAIAKYCN